jgi:hypothetical protein
VEEGKKSLLYAVEEVMRLRKIGSTEGLLALDEAGKALKEDEDHPGCRHLQRMMQLVVDGVDPDLVEEISLARYFVSGVRKYEAVQYMVFLTGALSIQAGDMEHIAEAKMLALVPNAVENEYLARKEETDKATHPDGNYERFFETDGIRRGEQYYDLIHITDCIISQMSDEDTAVFVKNVDIHVLELLFRVCSGKCIRHVFTVLDKETRDFIAEDLDKASPVHMSRIADATRNILTKLFNLIIAGKIEYSGEELVGVLSLLNY